MLKILILNILFFTTLLSYDKAIGYEEYFKNNRNIMLLIDPTNGDIKKANQSASEFYGYNISQLEKMKISDFNTFTKEQVQEELKKAKEQKRNYFLFSHRLADGSTTKVRVFSSPILVNNKKLLYSTIYPLNLEKEFLEYFNETLENQVELQTNQIKQNEAKIRKVYLIGFFLLGVALFIAIVNLIQRGRLAKEIKKQQIKYQTIMQNSSDAIFIASLDGYVIEYSKQFKEMLSYKDADLKNLHISDFEVVYSRTMIDEKIKKTTYIPTSFHSKYKKTDGTIIEVSLNIVRIKLDESEFIYASCRDISRQNQLQNEILEQKKEYEAIFEYAQDGIVLTDLELNFLNCNQAFVDMTGYKKEEILTKNYNDLTPKEFFDENKQIVEKTLKNGHLGNIEKSCIVADKRRLSVNMSISLLPDKKRLLWVLHDMTMLKLIEEQSKLASMGEMIGNIAHQWRQPLSVISTASSGIGFKLDFEEKVDKEDIKRITNNIVKQAKYLSKTIDDFKNFVKGDKTDRSLSIKDTLTDVINLTKATIDNNYIKLILDIEDDITIFGNKNELEQAFINIINNAKDSLKEHVKNDEDKFLFISTKKINEKSLSLKILDSGGGIPTNIIDRIFEPYFTTKHQSLGTGIGLSMVDKILRERHNGKIEVFNEEFSYKQKNYKGASFTIIFSKNK